MLPEPLLEAIDEFMEQEVNDPSMLGGRSQGPRPVTDFSDPDVAHNNCYLVASAFTSFLKEQGFKATTGLPMPGNDGEMHVDAWGYQDRSINGWNSHSATTVKIDGETYMIDFTAAQYGYSEFPMCQRLTCNVSTPAWERCPLNVPA